jgi:hypothetical protein
VAAGHSCHGKGLVHLHLRGKPPGLNHGEAERVTLKA